MCYQLLERAIYTGYKFTVDDFTIGAFSMHFHLSKRLSLLFKAAFNLYDLIRSRCNIVRSLQFLNA